MSPFNTTISVSAEAHLPFPTSDVWPGLREAAGAPEELPGCAEEGRLRWKDTGSIGWLLVEDPTVELSLSAEPGGTRLSMRFEARSAPEVSGLVRQRLEGYVAGVVAGCARGVERSGKPLSPART